ncbi:hypothetical protein V7P28_08090, partial [Klebsiella michiganensis]
MQQQNKPHLLRGLNARHIRFIALGSAIGTGLFYGSASAIKAAGPAVLLAYLIGGAYRRAGRLSRWESRWRCIIRFGD